MRATTHSRVAISNLEGDIFTVDTLDIDDSATAQPSPSIVSVNEYIVYAASFSVPAFYFTIHDSSSYIYQSIIHLKVDVFYRWTSTAPCRSRTDFIVQGQTP